MQSTLPLPLGATHESNAFANTATGKLLMAVAATGLVAICAHVSLPLYFTPVPLTLQTFAVLLTGLVLGPRLGFAAMALYLAEGAMGLPVFSPHGAPGIARLMGPAAVTAGYLFSYPFAAAIAGGVARIPRLRSRQFSAAVFAGAVASVLILAMGAGWLAHLLNLGAGNALRVAVEPFLPGEVLKVSAAAACYASLGRWRRF